MKTEAIEWAISDLESRYPYSDIAGQVRAELAALVAAAAGREELAATNLPLRAALQALVDRGHRADCPQSTAIGRARQGHGIWACTCGVDAALGALAGGAEALAAYQRGESVTLPELIRLVDEQRQPRRSRKALAGGTTVGGEEAQDGG
jgi:ribosomal protein L37AE/L43A